MTIEITFPLAGKRVWVAGHRGMVGAAIARRLGQEGCAVITADRSSLDLSRQEPTERWLARERPDAVFVAAARVGGILANDSYPASFLYENLLIEANIMEAARQTGVAKLLFLGSSCIYPKLALQPISESALLTGPLEPTNEWYAVAKIAGIKLAQAYRLQHGCDFISAMPTNLYGPDDNFDLQSSHVLPALIRKAHEAKVSDSTQLMVWGTGTPRREFLHVDDCADAVVHLMKTYSSAEHVNVGCGEDISIADLAHLVADEVGYRGAVVFDPTRPDGAPRKLLDVTKLRNAGWTHKTGLRQGIASTYQWFLKSGLQAQIA